MLTCCQTLLQCCCGDITRQFAFSNEILQTLICALKTFQPLKLWKPVAKQNNTKQTKGHKTRLKNTTVRSFPVSESSEKYELRVSHFSPCSALPSIPSQRVPFPFCMPTAINSTTCYSATSSILDFNKKFEMSCY